MNKYQKLVNRVIYHLPKRLPIGMTEFSQWASDICQTYDMPDNTSTHHALAVSIMHLPPTAAFKPRAYFGHILLKGAAQEIAYATIQAAQDAKKAELVAAAAQQTAEATAIQEAAASETISKS